MTGEPSVLPELAEPLVDWLVWIDTVSVIDSVKIDMDVRVLWDETWDVAVPIGRLELADAVGKPDVAPVLSEMPVLRDTPVLREGVGKGYGGKDPYPPGTADEDSSLITEPGADEESSEVAVPIIEELLVPVTGDPEVLLPDTEMILDETAVTVELGPAVVRVNLVKEMLPYPYGDRLPDAGAELKAPGEVPSGMIEELLAVGKGTELDPVTGEPGVELLMPVEYVP